MFFTSALSFAYFLIDTEKFSRAQTHFTQTPDKTSEPQVLLGPRRRHRHPPQTANRNPLISRTHMAVLKCDLNV